MTRQEWAQTCVGIGGAFGVNVLSSYVPQSFPRSVAIIASLVLIICSTPPGLTWISRIWGAARHCLGAVAAFVRSFARIIVINAVVIIAGTALWSILVPKHVPKEVQEARLAVLQLQRIDSKSWYAAAETDGRSVKKLYFREYELVVEEDLGVTNPSVPGTLIKTYIVNGRKLAADSVGSGPSAFVREYFSVDSCRFARDHFDSQGRPLFLEYWPRCAGDPKVFDLASPVFLPPFPVVGYR